MHCVFVHTYEYKECGNACMDSIQHSVTAIGLHIHVHLACSM